MNNLWDQLAISEPEWRCLEDAELFIKYKDNMRLVQFLMALRDDYEPMRANLLHCHPLPTFRSTLAKLISEETHLHSMNSKITKIFMASASKSHA